MSCEEIVGNEALGKVARSRGNGSNIDGGQSEAAASLGPCGWWLYINNEVAKNILHLSLPLSRSMYLVIDEAALQSIAWIRNIMRPIKSTNAALVRETAHEDVTNRLTGLPNDILYDVTDLLPAQDLMNLSQVNRQMRELVAKRSTTIVKEIRERETRRLEDGMLVSGRPDYTGMSIDEALRVWCKYWGRPHFTCYQQACSHFGQDYHKQNQRSGEGCLPTMWRTFFWSRLAEFLLHVSDLAILRIDGLARTTRYRSSVDWIEHRALAGSKDYDAGGASFLKELRDTITLRSNHYCVITYVVRGEWLSLVEKVRY